MNIKSVKSIGTPWGGTEIRGYYIIRFSLKDVYGGLGSCTENPLSNIRKVKVNKISLKIDDLSLELGDVFTCPSIKGDGEDKYVYLGRSNEIVCYVYLDKLVNKCKNSNNCYLDENSLKLGKSAMISIELEYDYCRSITLGPAKITTLS